MELTEELKQFLKQELGYTDEELENVRVYTREEWEDMMWDLYVEVYGDSITRLLWYVDWDLLLEDESLSGNVSVLEYQGKEIIVEEA